MKNIMWLILIACTGLYAGSYQVEDVTFESKGVQLSGSIVLPKDGKVYAAVIFVHGSGRQKRSMGVAQRFADDGIAALVYDKRGVGQSGGTFEKRFPVSEKNLDLLINDALAGFNLLREHPKTKALPLGITGISQAGWIVPPAAQKANGLDFIVLWSGPVCKVSEEDIFSKFTADLDRKKIPSYQKALDSRTEPYVWPDFLGKDSDPSDTLPHIKAPGLWIFGGNDGSVPVDLSIQRLTTHIESGKPFEYVLFSNLGHNNMSETFSVVTKWIKRQQL